MLVVRRGFLALIGRRVPAPYLVILARGSPDPHVRFPKTVLRLPWHPLLSAYWHRELVDYESELASASVAVNVELNVVARG